MAEASNQQPLETHFFFVFCLRDKFAQMKDVRLTSTMWDGAVSVTENSNRFNINNCKNKDSIEFIQGNKQQTETKTYILRDRNERTNFKPSCRCYLVLNGAVCVLCQFTIHNVVSWRSCGCLCTESVAFHCNAIERMWCVNLGENWTTMFHVNIKWMDGMSVAESRSK